MDYTYNGPQGSGLQGSGLNVPFGPGVAQGTALLASLLSRGTPWAAIPTLAQHALSIPAANAGEQAMYTRDPSTGQMVLNPNHPQLASNVMKQQGAGIGGSSGLPQSTPSAAPPNLFGTPPSGNVGAVNPFDPQSIVKQMLLKSAQANGQTPVTPNWNAPTSQETAQWPVGPVGAPQAANSPSPLDTAQWPAGPNGSPGAAASGFGNWLSNFKLGQANPNYTGPGSQNYIGMA